MSMLPLPRVSTILESAGLAPDYSVVPPEILEAAQKRGDAIHSAIEDVHYGVRLPTDVEPEIEGYMAAYLRFALESKHEPIASEIEVFSERWRFVGHPDRVGWVNGVRALLDWKSTADVDEVAASYQLQAYKMAWEEMHPTEPIGLLAVVQLRPDATYRLYPIENPEALQVWQAAVILYHARHRNGR